MVVPLGDCPASHTELTARGWSGSDDLGDTRITEAWRALKAELPDLKARMDAGLVESGLVVDVVCAAALRVLANPDARTEESHAVPDYTESWKLGNSSTDLYFTAAELRRLSGAPAPTAGSFKYS